MADRDLPVLTRDHKRLAFANGNFAGGGIAYVSDCAVASKPIQQIFFECVPHVAHRALENQLRTVGRNDPARFLPTMLQRIHAQIGKARGIWMAIDAEHAALFAQFVVRNGEHGVLRLSRLHVSFNPDLSGTTHHGTNEIE